MRIVHDRGSLADEKIIETDVAASGEVARLLRFSLKFASHQACG